VARPWNEKIDRSLKPHTLANEHLTERFLPQSGKVFERRIEGKNHTQSALWLGILP